MKESEFFFRISPDRVLEAVESEGMRTTGHCMALNALENRVYDVRLEEADPVVIKFYRPGRWSRETIQDEHEMLFAMRDAEIPVCAPLVFDDGESLHETEDIFYAIWPRTGGRSPDEFSDTEVDLLGRLLARIHNTGAATRIEHRPTLDPETYPLASLALLEEGDFLPPSCADRYRKVVESVVRIYDQRLEGIELLPIHGDCHRGNLLRNDQGWSFLDFDDMMIGPAVHDVWMMLPGRDVEAHRQRDRLVDAYEQFRPFDRRSFALIEPLRAFRFIFYAGWIAKRWDDPAFPDAFPHFGTEQYWQNETADLEDQLELIRSGGDPIEQGDDGIGGGEREAEGELSNKDFFWDL
ncbi:MAG: serine/threonine protein kinase [Deltaproteobacteria bacterium]|nr:serine/threonine protein kinase [Deltaproteobacteria bacterium]MBW2387426.1 serine/threonine protein kinase [Deltaproteobacteria bacterium]